MVEWERCGGHGRVKWVCGSGILSSMSDLKPTVRTLSDVEEGAQAVDWLDEAKTW